MSVRRFGAGGIRNALRTRRTVEALTRWPSLSSSPCVSARKPPGVVLGSEPLDERSDSALTGWPDPSMRIGPLPGDQAAVPPEHGARRDQPVHPQLGWQQPDQGGEDHAVGPVQPGPRICAAQHSDLMSQYQQLDVLGGPRAAEQDKPAAEPNEDEIHQPKGHGRSSWPTADADAGTLLQLGDQADFWHPAGRRHRATPQPSALGGGWLFARIDALELGVKRLGHSPYCLGALSRPALAPPVAEARASAPRPGRRAGRGHSVAVLHKVYAKCIDGQDQIAKRRIEDALAESDDTAAPATGNARGGQRRR